VLLHGVGQVCYTGVGQVCYTGVGQCGICRVSGSVVYARVSDRCVITGVGQGVLNRCRTGCVKQVSDRVCLTGVGRGVPGYVYRAIPTT